MNEPNVMKIEELGIPGMTSKLDQGIDLKDYSVKYFKADLDKDEDRSFLQDIETRGVRGDGVAILTRDKMSFMDKYFLVIQYLEKT